MKAGANNHDKNYIRRLHNSGHSVEQIAALTDVRLEHVVSIVKRLEETGKLLFTSGRGGKGGKIGGGGEPIAGGMDGESVDQRTAENKLKAHEEGENADLKRKLEQQNAELKALKDAQKPKRTRRTKEQIEADNAAAAAEG